MRRALAADAALLRRRHLLWVIAIVALGILGFVIAQPLQELAPASPAQVSQARVDFETDLTWWESHHEALQAACLDDGGTVQECSVPKPEIDDYLPWQADYHWASRFVILVAAALLGVTTFGIGAVYVGADFANGTMTTWHTHLPRRGVMVASKLITVGYLSACGALLTFAAVLLAVYITAGVWNVPVESGQLGESFLSALRGVGFVTLSGILGAAASFVTRRASITIALGAGYAIINRLAVSYELFTGAVPVLDFITQAKAWVEGGFQLNFWNTAGPQQIFIDPTIGGLVWVALTAVAVALAFVVHHRRALT